MRQYHWLLERVLDDHPEQRRCLSHCCHCGIAFLTDPRNAGREDLRCPFGCSDAHRKQQSAQRSAAYYRTPEGKIKKRIQNGRRRPPSDDAPLADATPTPALEPSKVPGPRSLIAYLQSLTSLIEGRQVSRDEVVRMLQQVLRQHRMARRRKADHLVSQLQQLPP